MALGSASPQILKSLDVTTALHSIIDNLDELHTKFDEFKRDVNKIENNGIKTEEALRRLEIHVEKLEGSIQTTLQNFNKSLNDPQTGLIVQLNHIVATNKQFEDEQIITKVRHHAAMIKIQWALIFTCFGILGKIIFF